MTLAINQPAVGVLGQKNFSSSTNPSPPTASSIGSPEGIAIDPTTGALFVADNANNRVLRFSSAAALTTGAMAEAVLGQPDFVSKGSATTAVGMNGPIALAVDSYGTLWVADTQNYRVLRFDHASAKASGDPADGVLGQPNFVTNMFNFPPTPWSVSSVYGLAVNAAGTLWIADTNENRVLRFDYASAKPNGVNADAVLGQVDFVSYASPSPCNAASMDSPIALALDEADHLWVGDVNNNRILRFDHATLKPLTGASADAVIGQPTFATSFGVIQRYGIYSPSGLGIDASGTLWVGEFYDNRVLGFARAASLGNGPLATTVLGQTAYNYATRYIPATASSVSAPRQIVGDDAGNLWVCDSGNHRVLRFRAPDPAAPTLTVTSKRVFTTSAKTAPVSGRATAAAGFSRVEYRTAKGKFTPATGTTSWHFTAHLRPGPNVFFVQAVDQLGRATAAIKITIRRK